MSIAEEQTRKSVVLSPNQDLNGVITLNKEKKTY